MRTRTPIEVITRYATTVDTMQDAWVFVMEHMDLLGTEPSVDIHPCWGVDSEDAAAEPEDKCHFHVIVEGSTEMKNEGNDT